MKKMSERKYKKREIHKAMEEIERKKGRQTHEEKIVIMIYLIITR